jgi:hypothetical protein
MRIQITLLSSRPTSDPWEVFQIATHSYGRFGPIKILSFGHITDSGKSTCQRFALSYFRTAQPKLKVVQANCADYLKAVAYESFKLFGMKPASFYDTAAGRPARTIELPYIWKTPLQLWIETANFLYSIYPLISIEALIANVPPDTDVVLIGDMRRVVEADYINQRGGACYRVDRPGRLPISNIDEELLTWSGWSGVISNGGDLSNLEQQVRGICEGLCT